MADFRVTISDPQTGKAYQVEISGTKAGKFIGKKIGDEVGGDAMGLSGYTVRITGGSDKQGFPMRKKIPGSGRRRILTSGGVGYHPTAQGKRRRKTIRGEVISNDIGHINTVVVNYGKKNIEELLGLEIETEEEGEETEE